MLHWANSWCVWWGQWWDDSIWGRHRRSRDRSSHVEDTYCTQKLKPSSLTLWGVVLPEPLQEPMRLMGVTVTVPAQEGVSDVTLSNGSAVTCSEKDQKWEREIEAMTRVCSDSTCNCNGTTLHLSTEAHHSITNIEYNSSCINRITGTGDRSPLVKIKGESLCK